MEKLIWTPDDSSDVYGYTPARKPYICRLTFIEEDIEVVDLDDENWWDDEEE